MEIIRGENFEEVIINACEALQECFQLFKNRSVLFLSSGGSAIRILDQIDIQKCPDNFTITVLDERFGVDKKDTNYWQLMQTDFYKQLIACGVKSIEPFGSEQKTVEDAAKHFAGKLISWRTHNPNGIVIITQGFGADSHTAGIMPYPDNQSKFFRLFMEKDWWVRGYNATIKRNQYPERITVTFPFLLEWVDDAVVMVTGEEKRNALESIMSDTGEIHITPGRVVREMKNVRVYTDIQI